MGERWRQLGQTRLERMVMMVVGAVFVIVSPIIAPLPGPWSIALFAAGFGLMLKASHWVKKAYARFKRRYPAKGEWVDWGLRRESYRRRQARREAEAEDLAGDPGAAMQRD